MTSAEIKRSLMLPESRCLFRNNAVKPVTLNGDRTKPGEDPVVAILRWCFWKGLRNGYSRERKWRGLDAVCTASAGAHAALQNCGGALPHVLQIAGTAGQATASVRRLHSDDYLKCGRLEHGFLRERCDRCRHGKLVAFSCKRRGFCPSCAALECCAEMI